MNRILLALFLTQLVSCSSVPKSHSWLGSQIDEFNQTVVQEQKVQPRVQHYKDEDFKNGRNTYGY
jgi:hypothetical protein